MKKQISALCFTICCIASIALQGQQVPSFQAMKKNGIFVEPFAPLGAKKELRFGYERMLKRDLSLVIGLGTVLKNEDPRLPETSTEHAAYSFTRECESYLSWFLIIPVWTTKSDKPLPDESETVTESRYLRSHIFATAELKYFLHSNPRNKLPDGLYLAPGLKGGRELYSTYTQTRGSRNLIEVYDVDSETWGLPILLGGTSDTWTERVTVYEYEKRTRESKTHLYLHPYVRAGYQLPLGKSWTVDLSGQMLFKVGKEAFPDEDEFEFFNFGPRKKIAETSAVLRLSAWF